MFGRMFQKTGPHIVVPARTLIGINASDNNILVKNGNLDWTFCNTPIIHGTYSSYVWKIFDCCCGDSKILAVGEWGAAYSLAATKNQTDWVSYAQPGGSSNTIYAATYNTDRFFVTTMYGAIYELQDDSTFWTRRFSTLANMGYPQALLVDGNYLIQAGFNYHDSTMDAVVNVCDLENETWTKIANFTATYYWFPNAGGIAKGESKIIAVLGFNGDKSIAIELSSDLSTYRDISFTDPVKYSGKARCLTSVAYGNGRFVAVGMAGLALKKSEDNDNWTEIPITSTIDVSKVIYAGDRFLAVGSQHSSGRTMYLELLDNTDQWAETMVDSSTATGRSICYQPPIWSE